MLLLSDRGSLHRTDLRFSEEGRDQNSDTEPQIYEWPAEVRQLAEDMEGSRWPPGPLSGRAFSEVDMEPVYQSTVTLLFFGPVLSVVKGLFKLDKQDQSSDQADDVYETIDSMHSFWQNLDVPVEHVLTTFDVAFRAGEEPNSASRADFFTKSVLNSKRGYRALMQGRIPTEHISKQAPWHYNLTPSLRRLVPAISDSPGETIQNLRRYDLQSDDYRPGASISKEIEAREHLALDLALSKDVYSPHAIQLIDPYATLDEAFETMSRATEAMSIGIPEPPPVQFGFLRPVSGGGADHYGKVKDGGEDGTNCPLGVRLLLKEWEVGSDPQTYTHQDPYDSSGPTAAVSRGINKATTEGSTELKSQFQPQRAPPVIVAAPMAPPAIVSTQLRPPLLAQSQDSRITPISHIGSQPAQFGASQDPSSQEIFMSSTQILPGPYGGRLVPAKKKPAKKRLGGF
ncbi:hypothetical protein PHLCEN_2v5910 [Hermanssonia centrifuga]|uniref:RRN6 K-rich C-terminal domain-containing protein n=1 Tax=Hermanssonia centrifuga TaxID=98765 RepID=A0A2R6P156_9APHY|nr:hypothetical protein PHLCEN_2v5910 [Hermanssonia centrifuga]